MRFRLALYRLVFPFVLAVMLPAMLLRMARRGNFRRNFGQRLGFYSRELRTRLAGKKPIWLQSISVGETMVALKLARHLHTKQPALPIVLSVTTSTGFELAENARLAWLEIIYNPLDVASVVRRAIHVVQPRRLVLIEGIWPLLVAECRRAGVPVALIARLSPRSERRFRRFRWLIEPIFQLLDPICVQEPEDIVRWEKLGAKPSAIQCTGAIKFDEKTQNGSRVTEFAAFLTGIGVPRNAPILLGGSTFSGEEIILARTYQALRKRFPNLFLILVPRHFERTPEILTELTPLNLRIALRNAPLENAEALIVNTTGELRDWYHLATIVFMGKSLTANGGQNPVEAVLAGKPVIFGPHMENFAAIVKRWRADHAAVQIIDEAELQIQVANLLENPSLRDELAARAASAVAAHQGATERVTELIKRER
ncbi:MAG TPA: glycosyltransferase N-terminal domain-containing protein [Chthoniobacterales bacterium]